MADAPLATLEPPNFYVQLCDHALFLYTGCLKIISLRGCCGRSELESE
jgi:hypothetical protein